jgi:hypothetical protein
LLDHYGQSHGNGHEPLVNTDLTRQEYELLKQLVLEKRYPHDQLQVMWKIISECHSEILPNMLLLARIALTIPVQTAICERGFSTQNNIKDSSRNHLGEAQLMTLMTISIEGPLLKDFNASNMSKALVEFKTKKNRRIFQNFSVAGMNENK